MTNEQSSTSGLKLRSGPLIVGAALLGGGVMLALAGLAVGSAHLLSATRRWVDEMDVPPSELAKLKWAQAKAAAAAGAGAWQNGLPARQPADS
jgi:membrane protein implicated in regulation of membrane protease activity